MKAQVVPWPCRCRPKRQRNGFIAHSIRCPVSSHLFRHRWKGKRSAGTQIPSAFLREFQAAMRDLERAARGQRPEHLR